MVINADVITAPYDGFKKYCNHFACKIKKHKGVYIISSEDATNFFWLGMNLNFHSTSHLCETPADKYLTGTKGFEKPNAQECDATDAK